MGKKKTTNGPHEQTQKVTYVWQGKSVKAMRPSTKDDAIEEKSLLWVIFVATVQLMF